MMTLALMFPDMTEEELGDLTLEQYNDLLEAKAAAVLLRHTALNESATARTSTTTTTTTTTTTAAPTTTTPAPATTTPAPTTTTPAPTTPPAGRKKRSNHYEDTPNVAITTIDTPNVAPGNPTVATVAPGILTVSPDALAVKPDTPTVNLDNPTVAPDTPTNRIERSSDYAYEDDEELENIIRYKRQTTLTELFDAQLLPEYIVKGIHPVGGKIGSSKLCDCGIPTGKLRKELKLLLAWEDDMWDPATDNFKLVKAAVEKQVFIVQVDYLPYFCM